MEKEMYVKEDFAQKVRVPAIVEQDLKRIISERLEQCGLYFRVFSRTKTAASMEKKFKLKNYGGNRKLQDLVGVRINLYFDDDVQICRELMERTFSLLEWSTSERSDEEFKPTKLNGVFRLPEYLKAQISPETWNMCIDDTFEIQIKTMFFEGWHEIEHDMRYKGEELWDQFPTFSRYFNSILATLELCDKSMVTLFEDLGHALYKSGQWQDMIRCHFRVKMEDVEIYPEIAELMDEDQRLQVNSLGKQIYRTSKKELVDMLSSRGARTVPVNVNTIIAVINENKLHDARLAEAFKKRDVYNDGREESVGESRHYQLRPLNSHIVFQMKTVVNGSRMKEQDHSQSNIFRRCSDAIYSWIISRYGMLFPQMPERTCSWHGDIMAYHVEVEYDEKAFVMKMHVRHMDLEQAGRVWYSEAELCPDHEGRILFRVCNGYAEPQTENSASENAGMFFSYPGFYKNIVDSIGIHSGIECQSKRRIVKEDQVDELVDALNDPERKFPVVLITSCDNGEGLMDEEWLGAFRVSDFTRTVWRYAHVLTCFEDVARRILKKTAQDYTSEDAVPRMYIFWPGTGPVSYKPADVRNCSFGRHLEARGDARTYDIVYGGQAFYHQIVTDLRDWNVSADMWEGFRRESQPELYL